MGVQTMSSHGDDGRRGLSRQGSVYSLTLTEVETHLGEPLRSMNLDELLRTVLPAAVTGDGVVERTVERRQKRMIKNRESAARSRARKQAYTNELENKIALLEQENERLRKLKMLEPLEPPPEHERRPVPQPEVKQQLRRTNSATF